MPEWDELIKTVKRTWAKANGLPEINWDEEVDA